MNYGNEVTLRHSFAQEIKLISKKYFLKILRDVKKEKNTDSYIEEFLNIPVMKTNLILGLYRIPNKLYGTG